MAKGYYGRRQEHSLNKRGIRTAPKEFTVRNMDGRVMITDEFGDKYYLPSNGVRDFLGDLWDKTKDVLGDVGFEAKWKLQQLYRGSKRVGAAAIAATKEGAKIGADVAKESFKELGREGVDTYKNLRHSLGATASPVQDGHPEHGDISKADAEKLTTGNMVDAEELADMANNRLEIIRMKGILKKDAIATLQEAERLELSNKDKDRASEEKLKEWYDKEIDPVIADLKPYQYRFEKDPKEERLKAKKEKIKAEYERRKQSLGHKKAQHDLDVEVLRETGTYMEQISSDLEDKLSMTEG